MVWILCFALSRHGRARHGMVRIIWRIKLSRASVSSGAEGLGKDFKAI